MAISPADVGRRVVVRQLAGGRGPTGGPAMTDVLGHVRSVADGEVVVERRDGTLVTVRTDRIVSWKHVPEPPPGRRSRGTHQDGAEPPAGPGSPS